MQSEGHLSQETKKCNTNKALSDTTSLQSFMIDKYGYIIGHWIVGLLYSVYLRFTITHLVVFLVKYIPTGYYMYNFIKQLHSNSKAKIRQKQIQLEELQLKVQIVETKLSVRDSEFMEREDTLRQYTERLRQVRARVREHIAADDGLRDSLHHVAKWSADLDLMLTSTPEEEFQIRELIKEMKYEEIAISETEDKGERGEGEPDSDSVYSSLEGESFQDCRIKIVKVTNKFKVAYLKRYIKQKRLRRANKQAVLKKKMELLKKMLDDWHRMLNMAVSSKLLLSIDSSKLDIAPQEAMGDYSKPKSQCSDSDSDVRTPGSDMFGDEYGFNWTQQCCKPHTIYNEDGSESTVSKEYYDSHEYCSDVKHYLSEHTKLCMLPEETISEVIMEDKSDNQDLIVF